MFAISPQISDKFFSLSGFVSFWEEGGNREIHDTKLMKALAFRQL
jgi:hypothetical protein